MAYRLFMCQFQQASRLPPSNEYWRRGETRRMQKEREEEERPTRHSHYLIHGTPSQPSDKSLARWDGALKADERERYKKP